MDITTGEFLRIDLFQYNKISL